ncbi:hypothetical protein [Methylocystis iwaonis]|uniref:DUF892 family protein n=1 Tax=Methylocystis iwaonis TaxID=2885079 RepID=A0ABM8E551_9HYPH|nr:hypothetical protein [Methylocystis iwaonis]BDV33004.1 hypothetical protein SS37A_05330 [Methylocystis iwaonis]
MQTMTQLKAIHAQMLTELGNLPQYRALKAIDRFIVQMNEIYDVAQAPCETAAHTLQQKLDAAIESRVSNEQTSGAEPRVTPHITDAHAA